MKLQPLRRRPADALGLDAFIRTEFHLQQL